MSLFDTQERGLNAYGRPITDDPAPVAPPAPDYVGGCNSTVEIEDIAACQDQKRRILERLREGPATNSELVKIAERLSARILELRKAGHVINREPLKRDGKVVRRQNVYTLAEGVNDPPSEP